MSKFASGLRGSSAGGGGGGYGAFKRQGTVNRKKKGSIVPKELQNNFEHERKALKASMGSGNLLNTNSL